jgi:hypothetical protein
MQAATVGRSGGGTSATDITGAFTQQRTHHVARARYEGRDRITGWNLAQVRVRPTLKQEPLSKFERGEKLMEKWHSQLASAGEYKDDGSIVSDASSNMQIYKSTSKMDSLKHCSQWTKDNKKPFKSNGSKHWDIDLGVHLDSGSTFSLRMNEDYAKPGTVTDLDYMFNYGTNTGQRDLHQQIESNIIEGHTCMLDTEAQCNLDSLSELVRLGFRVRMDTDDENSFLVTKGTQRIKYEFRNGLYTHVPEGNSESDQGSEYSGLEYRECGNDDCNGIGIAHERCSICGVINVGRILKISYSGSDYCGIQTVRENVEGFTDKQVERATRAREVYHTAGAPGIRAFRIAVRSGLFKNCNITESDITLAEKIYGPGSSVLKGKMKRPTPQGIREDEIEIPPELTMHNLFVDMHIDLVFINNTFGLTAIDGSVRYRSFVALRSRSATALYDAIDKCFRVYNARNFTVKKIYCDGEFRPVFDPVKDELKVHMNYASRGEHDPKAERNNQHLKELFRVHYHRMPFKAIPRKITEALAYYCAKVSNYYPAKGGLSLYYSPYMIMHQRMVDASKELVAEVGSYVHGFGHDTKSNMAARTIEGIYLGPTDDVQEGHRIWNLDTKAEGSRAHIRVLPMTDQIIRMVEEEARLEGVTELRTYTKRNGELILDADLLEGVDPDELWDEDYSPNEETEKSSDTTLRNENITSEEIDELLLDAEGDIMEARRMRAAPERGTIDFRDDERDDAVFDEMFERIRERQEAEDEIDEDFLSDIDGDYESDEDDELDSEEAAQMLDELAAELVELGKPDEEEIEFDFDEEDEDEEENEPEDVSNLQTIGETKSSDDFRPGVRFEETETSEPSMNEVKKRSYDDDGIEVPKKRVLRPRSGKSFYSNEMKMRPTDRYRRERPRYGQAYLQRKKTPKPNILRNRRAMRRKVRMKRLRVSLYQAIKERIDARRKGKVQKVDNFVESIKERMHNLAFQQVGNANKGEYDVDEALVVARVIQQIRDGVNGGVKGQDGVSFIQQYYLNKGLKIFKERGKDAAMKELDQLVKRSCWTPISIKDLKESEKKKAVDAMMLLAEKNDGVTVKGRCVFKGNETRDWLSKEDTASPTASHEAIICTGVIDAHEGRAVMSMDIPNAFIQTLMPEQGEGEDRVIMKITGLLVDYMIDLDPTYRDYVVYENGRRVIYVVILRAIYGMLQASLLWYRNLRASLEEYGFVFNRYDPCIANRMINGKQLTIRFHVDDVLASHMEQAVLEDFFTWINERYGGLKEVTCTRGRVHTYLGMTLDYSKKGKLKIRMNDYVERMLDEFSVKFKESDSQETPAGNNLLEVGKGKDLDKVYQTEFHKFVAKSLFLSKRARLDICPTVAILASRVRNPNQSDWHKLVRMMRYLHSTRKWHLTLSADNLNVMKWFVDASFAVHPDFKSHTGGVMTMGGGAMQALSKKQKLNSRSSTHAELIGVDDAITQVLWTRLFMEEQGYPIEKNILYQDNMSSILLEKNGRSSAGKRSRALNIRYFFVTDQVEKGTLTIEHMPTDDMWGDYMTKPLQGEKFRKFRALIQGDQED